MDGTQGLQRRGTDLQINPLSLEDIGSHLEQYNNQARGVLKKIDQLNEHGGKPQGRGGAAVMAEMTLDANMTGIDWVAKRSSSLAITFGSSGGGINISPPPLPSPSDIANVAVGIVGGIGAGIVILGT